MRRRKYFENAFVSVGLVLILALLIVLYQVNFNGKSKAIMVQNSLDETSEERAMKDDNKGSNNEGTNTESSSSANDNQAVNSGATDTSRLININQATLEELQTLKGIGPSKAQAIIDYRNTQGEFQHISEITNVSGIGEKTFEHIKEYITVGKE